MPLHLIKLSVGTDSIEDLEDWIKLKLKEQKKRGVKKPERIHTTRMVPKRAEEILDGGSIYWVIRGEILCRERILDIRPFVDKDGVGRCRLVLDPKCVPVRPRPYRAFQGWRYLAAKDAPPDLDRVARGTTNMPEPLRRELRELGLLLLDRRYCRSAGCGRALPRPAAAPGHRHGCRSAPASRRGALRDNRPQSPRARSALRPSASVAASGLSGLDAAPRIPSARDRASARPRARSPTGRRCATTSRGRPSRAPSARRRSWTGMSRSRAIAVTTLSC